MDFQTGKCDSVGSCKTRVRKEFSTWQKLKKLNGKCSSGCNCTHILICKPSYKKCFSLENVKNGGKRVCYIQEYVEGIQWWYMNLETFPFSTGILVGEFIDRRWGMGKLWLSPTLLPKLWSRRGNTPTLCPSQFEDCRPWGNWTWLLWQVSRMCEGFLIPKLSFRTYNVQYSNIFSCNRLMGAD